MTGVQTCALPICSNARRLPLQKLMARIDKSKPVILLDHQPYQLAESQSANGVINGLGGRVQKELGRFEVKGIGNIAPGTKFITVMKSKETGEKPKRYLWTIRDELVQAIKELDFFGSKEITTNEYYSDDELINAMEANNTFDVAQTFE